MAILFCLESKRWKSCLNKLKTSVKLPEVSHEKDITSQVFAMNFKGRVPRKPYMKAMKNLGHLVQRELRLIWMNQIVAVFV